MTRFLDGPAGGKTLMLKRAPMFLRAVRDRQTRQWDALDQLEDDPGRDEEICAYRIEGKAGWVHINRGGGRGGTYTTADYKAVDPQPDDAVLRDTAAWRHWCQENRGPKS